MSASPASTATATCARMTTTQAVLTKVAIGSCHSACGQRHAEHQVKHDELDIACIDADNIDVQKIGVPAAPLKYAPGTGHPTVSRAESGSR